MQIYAPVPIQSQPGEFSLTYRGSASLSFSLSLSLSLSFFFFFTPLQAFNRLDEEGAIFFTQSTDSNIKLIQILSQKYTECLTKYVGTSWSSQIDT